jgi:hypothetical protein
LPGFVEVVAGEVLGCQEGEDVRFPAFLEALDLGLIGPREELTLEAHKFASPSAMKIDNVPWIVSKSMGGRTNQGRRPGEK